MWTYGKIQLFLGASNLQSIYKLDAYKIVEEMEQILWEDEKILFFSETNITESEKNQIFYFGDGPITPLPPKWDGYGFFLLTNSRVILFCVKPSTRTFSRKESNQTVILELDEIEPFEYNNQQEDLNFAFFLKKNSIYHDSVFSIFNTVYSTNLLKAVLTCQEFSTK